MKITQQWAVHSAHLSRPQHSPSPYLCQGVQQWVSGLQWKLCNSGLCAVHTCPSPCPPRHFPLHPPMPGGTRIQQWAVRSAHLSLPQLFPLHPPMPGGTRVQQWAVHSRASAVHTCSFLCPTLPPPPSHTRGYNSAGNPETSSLPASVAALAHTPYLCSRPVTNLCTRTEVGLPSLSSSMLLYLQTDSREGCLGPPPRTLN